MDILTLELPDVTVSDALRQISRALEAHPALPLRILSGGDGMLVHNVQRFLERSGLTVRVQREGPLWRIDADPPGGGPEPPAHRALEPLPRVIPAHAPLRPLLLTRASLAAGAAGAGRRLLLGILRDLDPQVPWVGLTLDAALLLEDPEALALLAALQARGTRVRISRDCLLFPDGPGGSFEVIEDSEWQRLAGRGELTVL